MHASLAAVITALLASHVQAHGQVKQVSVKGGESFAVQGMGQKSNSPVWAGGPQSTGPVMPNDSDYPNNIVCHLNSSPAAKALTVAAGSTIDLLWKWPDQPTPEQEHPGLLLDYLAPAGTDDISAIKKAELRFVKLQGKGYDPSVPLGHPDFGLATGTFKKDKLHHEVTIPANTKAGTYVLRHEIITLHLAAASKGKSEHYPQCVTLKITGSGTVVPDAKEQYLAKDLYADKFGTSLYVPDLFGKSWNPKNYVTPGPPVWSGAGSTGAAAAAGNATTAATTAATTTTSDTGSSDDTTPSSSGKGPSSGNPGSYSGSNQSSYGSDGGNSSSSGDSDKPKGRGGRGGRGKGSRRGGKGNRQQGDDSSDKKGDDKKGNSDKKNSSGDSDSSSNSGSKSTKQEYRRHARDLTA